LKSLNFGTYFIRLLKKIVCKQKKGGQVGVALL